MSGSPRDRNVGLGLLAVAAILLLTAVLVLWGGINRWRAVSAVNNYQLARMAGNSNDMKDYAAIAQQFGTDDAALALPAMDLMDEDSTRLDRLRRSVPSNQRTLIDCAIALQAAVHGKSSDSIDGINGKLIAHIAALANGELPPFPTLTQGDMPYVSILDRAAQHHAQRAWIVGDAKGLKDALSILALLRPNHADNPKSKTVLAAVSDNPGIAATFIHEVPGKHPEFLRQMALLTPDTATTFIRLIPENERTAAEMQVMLLAGGDTTPLKTQVEKAIANPSDPVLSTVFRRCLMENDTELAESLIPKASDQLKYDMRLAVAFHVGDVATIAKLLPDRKDLKPTITTPIGRNDHIAFHLTTPSGFAPRTGALDIRIDNERVPPGRIKRMGSLVEIEFKSFGQQTDLEVKLSEQIIFAGTVNL